MQQTVIRDIEVHLPERLASVEQIIDESFADGQQKKDAAVLAGRVKAETGIEHVAMFEPNEPILPYLTDMTERMLSRVGATADQVSYLMCGNEALFMEGDVSPLHALRDELGLRRAIIMPIVQPCTAAIMALGLSRRLLGPDEEYMLVVTGNRWPEAMRRWPQVTSRYVGFTLMGDGLAVMLIGLTGDGPAVLDWSADHYDLASAEHAFGAEAQGFLERRLAVISKGAGVIQGLVERNGLAMDDVATIVAPNVNRMVFRSLYASRLGVDPDVFDQRNLSVGGHMCDVDLLRNLKDVLERYDCDSSETLVVYSIDVEPTHDVNYHAVLMSA